jgi:hypothetical protein
MWLLVPVFLLTVSAFGQGQEARFVVLNGIEEEALRATVESNLSMLLTACNEATTRRKKPNPGKQVMTADGRRNLHLLWETTELSYHLSQLEEKCLRRPVGGFQVRNIPVTLMAAPEEDSRREIIVNFTATGQIDDVFVAIPGAAYEDVLSKYRSAEDFSRRQVILDFLTTFSNAYDRKDWPLIEKVFSDDALIITGKVVKVVPRGDQPYQSLGRERIEYLSQTKEQYIKRLKSLLASYKYINVRFDSIEVVRHPVIHEIYGITLVQDWRSRTYADSRYSDVGYLFLMIDFRDDLNPLIQVRTWQPTFYDNRPLRRDEVFSLASFPNIVRKEN